MQKLDDYFAEIVFGGQVEIISRFSLAFATAIFVAHHGT